MNDYKILIMSCLAVFLFSACEKDDPIGTSVSDLLWLENEGAQMPILVEGNTASKTILLIIHGGPGGTAKVYNETLTEMSEPLEERYGVAYWDQRLAGNSRGHFEESDVTVAQMVEDTRLVVNLLRHRYGDDISIFLLGHSWGGYLGTAFLAEGDNQNSVNGWIEVDGAHDIRRITIDGVTLMKEIGQGRGGEWTGILNFANDFDTTFIDRDKTLDVNRKAWEAIGAAQDDNLINEWTVDFEILWKALFTDHSTTTNVANTVMVALSNLWQEALYNPLSDDLEKITVPSLLLWGRYDFVVSPTLGEEAFEKLGTPDEDKSLFIFQRSGHSPMQEEPELFIDLVIDFMEKYK